MAVNPKDTVKETDQRPLSERMLEGALQLQLEKEALEKEAAEKKAAHHRMMMGGTLARGETLQSAPAAPRKVAK